MRVAQINDEDADSVVPMDANFCDLEDVPTHFGNDEEFPEVGLPPTALGSTRGLVF